MSSIPGSSTGPKLRFIRNTEDEGKLQQTFDMARLGRGDYLRIYYANCPDGQINVIVSHEPASHKTNANLWHISVSHTAYNEAQGRCPTWDEMKQAKYLLLPETVDVEMVMVMPLKTSKEYVDVHPYTLHLFESEDGVKR